MPFKSYKQFKKFASLVSQGKMDKSILKEWAKDTDFTRLPNKAKMKKK